MVKRERKILLVPKEKIILNNNQENQYNEKVVKIKKQIRHQICKQRF